MTDLQKESPLDLAIVDDDAEFRALVRRVAEPLGWRITEFQNGADLLQSIGLTLNPSLIILDIVMPGFDGIETIGGIGGTSVRCPVVLVTGRLPLYTSTAQELAQANGIEVIDILFKPVPLKDLRAALDPARI